MQWDKNSFTMVKIENFHSGDVYSCIGYSGSGAQLDANPLGSATINSLEQSDNESVETKLTQLSNIWQLETVTSISSYHAY